MRTGDDAAAPRYIEARLSKFALEVAFNAKTTEWQLSYDGRKQEPVVLPMKFPLLLAQGADSITVGLSTKYYHNFCGVVRRLNKIPQGKIWADADFFNRRHGRCNKLQWRKAWRKNRVRAAMKSWIKDTGHQECTLWCYCFAVMRQHYQGQWPEVRSR